MRDVFLFICISQHLHFKAYLLVLVASLYFWVLPTSVCKSTEVQP
nr:MAG TPA: hypothetical protein [Caudoviricetes sp.]